ncbi:hypothetical protein M413DRAFT_14349 [Hebeloma cylindrosporum]|uniref:Uncharacterized protein n=1 Tax=Hebeloma cylindrosporum TaxID=76867 RepID=A0A0C3BUM7_HEBCY|nr:hypothetical protein M413DRAFT_14349 [Hebeloma cylindrosporum h7]
MYFKHAFLIIFGLLYGSLVASVPLQEGDIVEANPGDFRKSPFVTMGKLGSRDVLGGVSMQMSHDLDKLKKHDADPSLANQNCAVSRTASVERGRPQQRMAPHRAANHLSPSGGRYDSPSSSSSRSGGYSSPSRFSSPGSRRARPIVASVGRSTLSRRPANQRGGGRSASPVGRRTRGPGPRPRTPPGSGSAHAAAPPHRYGQAPGASRRSPAPRRNH